MILRTKTVVRSWSRRLGVTPFVAEARRRLFPKGYEDKFGRALLEAVRPGDCVWDVGANVGLYTALLSEKVGIGGTVLAFEPAPGPFGVLSQLGKDNVRAFNLALGAVEGRVPLAIADDPLGATHRLASASPGGAGTVEVRVATGDGLVSEGLRPPNVIKIDVEGYEEEVLAGLAGQLREPSCRALFCEIHFAILEERGQRHAPSRIEAGLRSHAFRVQWIDASHLAATR